MAWQDIIIAVGAIFFALSLIPSLITKDKPAFKTSVMTSFVLFIMIFTYATLGLWLSTAMNVVMCTLWAILAVQKYKLDKTTGPRKQ